MATPIFVLGVQRSGTTWLANLLNAHPEIAGVVDEAGHGTRESVYFRYFYGRYGDLSIKANFIEFVEVVSALDYFVLAGADKEFLYTLWPTDYAAVFRAVMEAHAGRCQASCWVEKSPDHTLYATRIVRLYPDARFIAIERDPDAVIASFKEMHRSRFRFAWWRYVFVLNNAMRWVYYQKAVANLSRVTNSLLQIQYADLRDDTEATLRKICDFLSLDYAPRMLDIPFKPNTSFRPGVQRHEALTPAEKRLVWLGVRVARLIPYPLMRRVTGTVDYFRYGSRRRLPDHAFRLTRPAQESGHGLRIGKPVP